MNVNKDQIQGSEGFSMIEAVVSGALILLGATAFFTMAAANGKLLLQSGRIAKDSYGWEAAAGDGEGEKTGETMDVIFEKDGEEAVEVFDQYRMPQDEEMAGEEVQFFRYREP